MRLGNEAAVGACGIAYQQRYVRSQPTPHPACPHLREFPLPDECSRPPLLPLWTQPRSPPLGWNPPYCHTHVSTVGPAHCICQQPHSLIDRLLWAFGLSVQQVMGPAATRAGPTILPYACLCSRAAHCICQQPHSLIDRLLWAFGLSVQPGQLTATGSQLTRINLTYIIYGMSPCMIYTAPFIQAATREASSGN